LSVKVSPISRGAALLIMVVGLLTFVFVNDIAGLIFVVLGIALYWMLYRLAHRVRREIEEQSPKRSG
jgi:glycopeptide antibiotics resistance protein